MEGKCRLCLKDSVLNNSHIIPEYFYKPMYDTKHRFLKVSPEPNKKNKFVQKGLREYLLCNDCEQHINEFEKYANSVMFYEPPKNINQNHRIAFIEGIDYKLMKLFQLSIIWRASVSSLQTFSEVKLGPHQERLRKMVLDSKPGKYTDYGCLQTAIFIERNKLASDLLMPVDLVKINNFKTYRFIFGGMMWLYFVSNHNEKFKYKNMFLQENGTLTLTKYPIEKIKYLFKYWEDLYNQGKLNAN
jgi:hypothetical protein